ncbi:MAG: putative metalloprotease with PDZ domain [Mariniblastus sp.]
MRQLSNVAKSVLVFKANIETSIFASTPRIKYVISKLPTLHHATHHVAFRLFIFTLALCAACTTESQAIANETTDSVMPIRYRVDMTDSKNHYLTITATVPAEGDTTELMMAVWTPGSYLVREYARNIDSMEATDRGKPLAFEKSRKNRWLVQTKGLKSFTLKYRLYCNEMSVRTNWVGNEYAMVNGAPTFLTVPGKLDRPHVIQLKLPRSWTRSATSLHATGDTPHTFQAQDFDELVDSPIVAGNINVYPFSVGGVEHQLVNVGESGQWNGTKAATDLKKVVQAHQDMWGTVPYDRYLFLNMIVEAGGGLEHDNSTVLMTSRWSFRDPGRYKSWLSLASHEFFHTWNVRRLRPKSLVKYDYENEVYTNGLWIAEGVTSYYQDLALVRAGITSKSEFLSGLSRDVEGLQRTEGRKKQSLKDSSYDAWIKFYRPDENSSNTSISYYAKGAVVAFLLDAKIRKLTDGEKSLDDLMRTMFAKYSDSGFTSEDFRATASKIAGEDLSDWFASAIDSTDELDYSDIEAIGVVVPNQDPAPPMAKPAAPPVKTPATAKTPKPKPNSDKDKADAKHDAGSQEKAANKGKNRRGKGKRVNEGENKGKPNQDPADPVEKVKPAIKVIAKTSQEEQASKTKAEKAKKSDARKAAAAKRKSELKKSEPSKGEARSVKSLTPPNKAAKTEVAESKKPKAKPTMAEQLAAARKQIAALMAPARSSAPTQPRGFERPWLGFRSSSSSGKVTVSSVSPDSPASDVGLNNDDEIIALDGYRITSSVDARLSNYEVGDELELLIARRGKLSTVKITLGTRQTLSWRLRFVPKPTAKQKKQLERWLSN